MVGQSDLRIASATLHVVQMKREFSSTLHHLEAVSDILTSQFTSRLIVDYAVKYVDNRLNRYRDNQLKVDTDGICDDLS